jgi:hypothetical protein
MSKRFSSAITAVTMVLKQRPPDVETLGLLARALRWQSSSDADDLAALVDLWKLIQREPGPGDWEVERAVLEIFCERANADHVTWLITVFRHSGRHGNDRRRLALQALSAVAARAEHEGALQILQEGLAHMNKDTRGWAIGFLAGSYAALGRPLPQSAIDRLRFLTEHDSSPDVRVEAATALAEAGLTDLATVEAVAATANEQPRSKKSRKRLRASS